MEECISRIKDKEEIVILKVKEKTVISLKNTFYQLSMILWLISSYNSVENKKTQLF